jgi:Thiolase, C-terminal domain
MVRSIAQRCVSNHEAIGERSDAVLRTAMALRQRLWGLTLRDASPVEAVETLPPVNDNDIWRLNEAFASQYLYCRDKLGIDPAKYNINGGSFAIGVRHPQRFTRWDFSIREKMCSSLRWYFDSRKIRFAGARQEYPPDHISGPELVLQRCGGT